jgi:hypothetical protein
VGGRLPRRRAPLSGPRRRPAARARLFAAGPCSGTMVRRSSSRSGKAFSIA